MAKRTNIMPEDILLFHILPRLPARSIGCFMCVCKQWHSFLTTPMFTKMHLHHVNNQNHCKLLVVSAKKPCKYFRTLDCETPEIGLSPNSSLPFEVNSNEMSIISSLNGLVCVGINPSHLGKYKYSDIILWNPLTDDFKTLSKDNSHEKCFITARGYGLYYSCWEDDYKLLCITKSKSGDGDAYIYSLKSDSWRKVESTISCVLKNWRSSCLLNETLYFLAQGRSQTSPWSCLIIRFDTKTEKFTEIEAPFFEDVATGCFSMTVVSGCIHLCAISDGINSWKKLEMWRMDGDGEWTKVVSYCNTLCRLVATRLLHQMKNGNWLAGPLGKVNVYKVDLEMKTEKRCKYATTADSTIDILRRGKFVETIVSLKRVQWLTTCNFQPPPSSDKRILVGEPGEAGGSAGRAAAVAGVSWVPPRGLEFVATMEWGGEEVRSGLYVRDLPSVFSGERNIFVFAGDDTGGAVLVGFSMFGPCVCGMVFRQEG